MSVLWRNCRSKFLADISGGEAHHLCQSYLVKNGQMVFIVKFNNCKFIYLLYLSIANKINPATHSLGLTFSGAFLAR